MSEFLDKCFSPAQLNGLTLRNRIIKAATFEGKSPNGIPTDALSALHKRIGEGGTAMTTIAYCAAEADGRVMENMMYMHEGIRPQLEKMIAELHATGTKVSGQLSHCGNFTQNRNFRGKRPLGPSAGINMLGLTKGLPFIRAMTHTDMDHMVEAFAKAATFMQSVGFDAIEVHFGHGYGLSQFISPKTNHRTDEYGGNLENRMRLPLRVLAAVRQAVGESFPLLGKISMSDGVKGGVTYEESVEIAAMLEAGGIDAIICSGGTSSMNPMLLFRGDSIIDGLIENEKSAITRFALKWVGSKRFKAYPYEELYFIEQAKRIRERVKCQVVYIGGVCTSKSIEAAMAAGFDFIQIGRGLIYDPDLVKHAQNNPDYVNGCTHCNRCAGMIDAPDGIRCVLTD